jgi:serine protease Do
MSGESMKNFGGSAKLYSESNLRAACIRTVRRFQPFRSLVALGILLASAYTSFGATSLLTPEAKRDLELQPGVVLIKVSFEATLGSFSCTGTGKGTGFLYRPDGYLITNGHVAQWARSADDSSAVASRMKAAIPCLVRAVVENAEKTVGHQLTEDEQNKLLAEVKQAIDAGRVQIKGDPTIEVDLDNGMKYQGEIKAYSEPVTEGGKDIAIIKIDGRNLPTVALGNSDGVSVGDQITVIGYPGKANISDESSLVATVTNGRISAIKKEDFKGTPVLQSEATIDHGNSGGPAFDANGQVIGIATFSTGASGINFFVPIDTAMEFVRQAGSTPERGPFDKLWLDALDAYAGQHWSKAHELMGNVLEMMPDQPDAKRLQLQSGTNKPTNPIMIMVDSYGMPVVAGTACAVLLLLLLIIFLAVRPRHKTQATVQVAGGAGHMGQGAYGGQQPPLGPQHPGAQQGVMPPHNPGPPMLHGSGGYGSLQIANGALAGNRFTIPKSGLLIGRDPSKCAVVIPLDSVSKEHALVVPLDNGVAVIDRNSSNGTYVNSTDSPRVNKIILKDGDRIFVGRNNATEITYHSS